MNDDQVDEFLRGDVPSESPEARERARLRLHAAIARESAPPVRRPHRLVGLAAAAVIAVAALLVLQVVLPPGPGGPSLSAAQEIRKLGRLSVRQEPLTPGPTEFIYTHMVELTDQAQGDFRMEYDLAVEADVTFWIGRDGSGRRETTLQRVDFISQLDRENWVKAGSPPLPQVGPTDPERFARGELTYYSVETLPTDPEELRRALEKGDVIKNGEGDVTLLSAIGTLLAQENLSTELRQALFEVASTIPTVAVHYDVTDHSGRPAVSVTATDASGDTKLFFDQSDAQLLGTSFDYPAADGHPAFTEWHVYLESGVVSKIGEHPAG
jgi:hypothetical protein